MILMYHKVFAESRTMWWVTSDAFWKQMQELKRFRVVPITEYDPGNPKHVVITFDGVYENVFTYAFPILKKFGYPFELFIVGDTIGEDNKFDQQVEPPAQFASREQLMEMASHGGRLQWHTRSHPDLTNINDDSDLERELSIPEDIRNLDHNGFNWFAYPHGKHTDKILKHTAKRFEGAVSCVEGNDVDIFKLNRITVTNETRFPASTVSLIIPNYNYGHFLTEAIESALYQTIQADEILFCDDCSDDNSLEIARRYKDRIKIVKNEKNLGIVDNFNKAVSLTSGELICFLGADNRFRSDYVEKCKFALDSNSDAAIAYTNVIYFGQRAELEARRVGAEPIPNTNLFKRKFPEFNESSREILKTGNFIHGSSMYRRTAFEEVGGYQSGSGPEDHHLFYRMIQNGWNAVLVAEMLLEYRQHSNDQANIKMNYSMELAYLRRQLKEKQKEIEYLKNTHSNNRDSKKMIDEMITVINASINKVQLDRSMDLVKHSLQKFPEQGKLIHSLGLLLIRNGQFKEAEEKLRLALLYNPNDAVVHNDLGVVRYKQNKINEAKECFSRALSIDATFISARQNLTDLKRKIGEVKEENEKPENLSSISLNSRNNIDASIVIPVHNQVKFTKQCIEAIEKNSGSVNYEIIVVDNASNDETGEFLHQASRKYQNFQFIRNAKNLGFSKACNQGAGKGKGGYLVFLNNDTIPQYCWLEEMVQLAKSDENIGIVGSKLLFPDGTIQHAGVVGYATHKPYHIYQGCPGDLPAANKQRDYQIVTGACMLIRRSLFFEVGSFDERFVNGCEDIDLCLRVGKMNKRIVYNPKSLVIHFEGQTENRQNMMHFNQQLLTNLWKNQIRHDDQYFLKNDGMSVIVNEDGILNFVSAEKN